MNWNEPYDRPLFIANNVRTLCTEPQELLNNSILHLALKQLYVLISNFSTIVALLLYVLPVGFNTTSSHRVHL